MPADQAERGSGQLQPGHRNHSSRAAALNSLFAINRPYKAAVEEEFGMARTDAMVLGAGIVGTSIALQLARRGLSVALVDRRAPGEETSYGNAGVIEGNTVFPPPFPDFGKLMRVA